MYKYFTYLPILMFSTLITADGLAEIEQNKREMVHKTMQNVNGLFDALLEELDATQNMYHLSCLKAQEREQELKVNLASLAKENEALQTIRAELALTQKDLQKAMENEAATQQKLARLQQHAGKQISHMRDEFESFKARLETSANNFDKVFW